MAYCVTQDKMEELVHKSLASRAAMDGEICAMLTFEFVECDAEKGMLRLKHIVPKAAANPNGNMHGGIITWLMDSTMGILSRSYTGYEKTVTMDIHVNFLKPVNIGAEMLISGYVTHSGRQIINVCSEAVVNGRICATADAIFYRVT